MRIASAVMVAAMFVVCGSALAGEKPVPNPPTVDSTHPGLAMGALTFAKLGDLPEGTLLRADGLTVTEKDVAAEIAKAPAAIQGQLKKNKFFLVEQMATKALLLQAAKKDAGDAAGGKEDEAVIQAYLAKIAGKVEVSDEEVAEFYRNNQDAMGGAALDKVKSEIAVYVRQQKQQDLVDQQIRSLGQRVAIEVSSPWVTDQVALARDNPVDKARSSGKPSLVDFGSKGCRPCDMLAPILDELKKKYDGKANVLVVSVVEEQILAARYGVRAIPVQVFFDKNGKEVFRHMGFYPKDEIEKQMAKLGVE